MALLVSLTLSTAQAQPKGYTLGDVVADFRLKNVDGRTISLADYRSQKGLIVVFMSNHCPFAKAYEDRVSALDRKFSSQGYPVLAIMPNDPAAYEEDSFENMKVRARDKSFPYAYTIDETQAIARAFGATRTPQVYVLKQTNNQFVLEYVGTIDDSPQDEASVQRRYVDEAVSSLLAGRPVQSPITKPIGCAIKWK
ncbi:thioredoxin family protein [Spirosoma foliorum]|uniref:Thioredoxin family protein n=1 Tax=Spirosoma foliorum TaxID=2710596 RepID=A0A7G5H7T7_9BACT|nr:thioredoxin family protein [Spirosoma foliorum]QMW07179.1 thioredoxin family protein [Spirosoma foliorum]